MFLLLSRSAAHLLKLEVAYGISLSLGGLLGSERLHDIWDGALASSPSRLDAQ